MAHYSKKEKEGIGGRVEAMRKEYGWTAEKLADLLDTTRSSVNMKERGERPFTLDEACNLCGLFDLTLDELVTGVKTQNVQIHKKLGLDNNAIEMLSVFYAIYDKEGMLPINKILSSIEALMSLARYLSYNPEHDGYVLEKVSDNDQEIITCKMSPEVYEVVLEQNLLRVLRLLKQGKKPTDFFQTADSYKQFLKSKKHQP